MSPATDPTDPTTRDRILDAAHEVFTRRGTAGARTQEIADEAGVNKALLHYYFGSKAELADAVFERAATGFFPALFGVVASPAAIPEKVRRVVEVYLDMLGRHPYLLPYLVGELQAHPERIKKIISARGPAPVAVLQRQLDDEAAAGRLRPIRAEHFMMNLVSLIGFPFVFRPAIQELLRADDGRLAELMDERRRVIPEFFLNALRP